MNSLKNKDVLSTFPIFLMYQFFKLQIFAIKIAVFYVLVNAVFYMFLISKKCVIERCITVKQKHKGVCGLFHALHQKGFQFFFVISSELVIVMHLFKDVFRYGWNTLF